MTVRLSRRVFLGVAAASAAAVRIPPALAACPPRDGDLLLLVHEGTGGPDDARSAFGRLDPGVPTLVVGDRELVASVRVALVSWGALGLLPAARLADLLQGEASLRVASAAAGHHAPGESAEWAALGRLMALRPPFGRLLVDLGGGGALPSRHAIKQGLAAFRAALGPASGLAVRFTGDPNRCG